MAGFYVKIVFCTLALVLQVNGNVLDMDGSFNEAIKDGRYWFVEFYAPWCGHCKRLEPIWEEVAAELSKQSSKIMTARIDCTQYRSIAEENGIRGFPTIKFFRGKVSAKYSGSLTKDALIEFAFKASRPILTELKTTEEFEKRRAKSDVFFLFVKDGSQKSEDYKTIAQSVAEHKISQVMFYTITNTLLPEDIKLEKVPDMLVFKDTKYYAFEGEHEANTTSLSSWVDREKFLPFMLISDSNVNELADTGKMVVFFTFSKDKKHHQVNKRLGEVGKNFAYEMHDTFGKQFQFAGIFDTDVIESIMMSTFEAPMIFVLNPESRLYYMLPASELSESFNEEQLKEFLQDVLDGKAVGYGGKYFTVRLRRIWWDVRSSAKEIWTASPVMAIVLFGLPCLVFSFLIVMLCCLEPAPEEEMEHEDSKEQREVHEDEKGNDEDAPLIKPGRLKED